MYDDSHETQRTTSENEKERLANGSLPYMQFRVSGQGRRRGGEGVTRIKSETVRDSAKCFRRKRSAKDLVV